MGTRPPAGPRFSSDHGARILIMTAAYGEGHNAAANALAAAFNEEAPGTAVVVDVFALSCPRLNSFIRKAYLAAINGTPRLWKPLYAWMDQPGLHDAAAPAARAQSRMLEASSSGSGRPRSAAPSRAYAALLQRLAARGASGAALQHRHRLDQHQLGLVAPGLRRLVRAQRGLGRGDARRGRRPRRLHVPAFPVTPFFRKNEGIVTRPDLCRRGRPPRPLHRQFRHPQRRGDRAPAPCGGRLGDHLHRGTRRDPAADARSGPRPGGAARPNSRMDRQDPGAAS